MYYVPISFELLEMLLWLLYYYTIATSFLCIHIYYVSHYRCHICPYCLLRFGMAQNGNGICQCWIAGIVTMSKCKFQWNVKEKKSGVCHTFRSVPTTASHYSCGILCRWFTHNQIQRRSVTIKNIACYWHFGIRWQHRHRTFGKNTVFFGHIGILLPSRNL